MFAQVDPPRVTITNIRNGAEVVAQFNPEELEEQVAPNWARLQVQGLSHEVRHFRNTGPYTQRFTLYFRAATPEDLVLMQRARRQLMSWAYPQRIRASNYVGGGPPELLLIWPGMLAIYVHLVECRIKHQRFNVEGHSVQFEAQVGFEEARGVTDEPELLTSDRVAGDPEQRFGR